MPWEEETTVSLKQEFIINVLKKEKNFSQLCKDFNISRKTGYEVFAKFEEFGWEGLQPSSKAPLSHPNKTKEEMEEKIIETRLRFPTWGARKISKYLSNQGISSLPANSTITEILKRNNLITIEESLKRKKLTRFEKESPNDLWQTDFKGKFQILTKESCYPLTIIDDHSRFSTCIYPCRNEQFLSVKTQLIAVFNKYGLPLQMNFDNGNPWGNSKLLKYTKLTVWLMQLGIRVTHSRPRHPQTNGKNERFNRTFKNDLILRKPIKSFQHARKLFNEWRYHYNHERPHEAIGMEVPANKYIPSERSMPSRLSKIEYDENAILRKVRRNGYISYAGRELLVGEAFEGFHIAIKHNHVDKEAELYFGKHRIYTYDI
jgi:transposase InsO family protein